jgi:hypothetical protein
MLRPWSVVIHEHGRSGRIDYFEGDRRVSVEWEFGGRDVVAFIMSPSREDWDRMYTWALGRHDEILRRIGDEVVVQKAKGCLVDFDPREPQCLYIREPGAPGLR